jgi:hypothetical protein
MMAAMHMVATWLMLTLSSLLLYRVFVLVFPEPSDGP